MFSESIKTQVNDPLLAFDLPPYRVIPDVGLYLEQITKYITDTLSPLSSVTLTSSMISNYVKHKIIPNPTRKQYNREQIANLFFIAITKTVLSLEDIQLILHIQAENSTLEQFYEYFRLELKRALQLACEVSPKPVPASLELDNFREYLPFLNKVIQTAVNSIWLDRCLSSLRKDFDL